MDISAIDGVLSTLVGQITDLKSQYEDIITAIEAKKVELKDVHGIEVSANDLAALAAVKEKLVTDADEKAKEIRKSADTYYEEIIEKSSDKKNDLEVSRRRELEVYSYETDRKRSMSDDAVDDALRTKLKSLNTRQEELEARESDVESQEAEVAELNDKIVKLETSIEVKVEAAATSAKEKAERSAMFASNMSKANGAADAKIAESTINSLEEKVEDLQLQLSKADKSVINANEQLAAMAKSALGAQGDAATIAEVSKIAAGNK
jgi:chromosome segregation ATPase